MILETLALLKLILQETQLIPYVTGRMFDGLWPQPEPPVHRLDDGYQAVIGEPADIGDHYLLVPAPSGVLLLTDAPERGDPVLGFVLSAGDGGRATWLPTMYAEPIVIDQPANLLAMVVALRDPPSYDASTSDRMSLARLTACGTDRGVEVVVVG